eukprot:COSAG06_NODE_3018_length_5954_cov_3.513744_2_plen_247_part_00
MLQRCRAQRASIVLRTQVTIGSPEREESFVTDLQHDTRYGGSVQSWPIDPVDRQVNNRSYLWLAILGVHPPLHRIGVFVQRLERRVLSSRPRRAHFWSLSSRATFVRIVVCYRPAECLLERSGKGGVGGGAGGGAFEFLRASNLCRHRLRQRVLSLPLPPRRLIIGGVLGLAFQLTCTCNMLRCRLTSPRDTHHAEHAPLGALAVPALSGRLRTPTIASCVTSSASAGSGMTIGKSSPQLACPPTV